MAHLSIRVDDETLAAIDTQVGPRGRSGFIRLAIEVALGVDVDKIEPEKKSDVARLVEASAGGIVLGDFPADQVIVLSVIRKGRFSSKDIERKLGWLGLRYSKAERGLLAADMVRVDDGLLVEV